MNNGAIAAVLALVLAGCAEYGGDPFHSPTARDMKDAHLQYDEQRFASLKIGVSTRTDVEALLGSPRWWSRSHSGYVRLGYDFVAKEGTEQFPGITPASFVFDRNNVLVHMKYPGSWKTIPAPEDGGVIVVLAEKHGDLFLDGIVPQSVVEAQEKAEKEGRESLWMNGYARLGLTVRDVLVGEMKDRDILVEPVLHSPPIDGTKWFFILRQDRYGTATVLDRYWANEGFCDWGRAAEAYGFETSLKAIQARYPCKPDKGER